MSNQKEQIDTKVEVTGQDKGLQKNTLSLFSTIAISVASTSPVLIMTAVPAALNAMGPSIIGMYILAIIPMIMLVYCYAEFAHIEPDCGSIFVWVGRTMGPKSGFIASWGLLWASLINMPACAWLASVNTFSLFGLEKLIDSTPAILILGTAYLLLFARLCFAKMSVVAKLQTVLLWIQVGLMVVLLGVGIYKIATGDILEGGTPIEANWFNPFNGSPSAIAAGFTLCLFAYWGWDVTFTLGEETDGENVSAKSALVSVIVIALFTLITAIVMTRYAGVDFITGYSDTIVNVLGESILGSWAGKLLMLVLLLSILSSSQSTVLPAVYQVFSMSAYRAIPGVFARLNKKSRPSTATVVTTAVIIALFISLVLISENVLWDSLECTGLIVATYYGFTTWSCFWRWKHTIFESVRNFIIRGVFPLAATACMALAFVITAIDTFDPANSESSLFGIGGIWLFSVGIMIIGIVIMIILTFTQKSYFDGETLKIKNLDIFEAGENINKEAQKK